MHISALKFGQLFFSTYLESRTGAKIVDVGSLDVNGSLRSLAPRANTYIGIDFAPGAGVDVVIDNPYKLPFDDNEIDVVVSSSCFEHAEFFWLLFCEIQRILKPDGLCYINAPSNGPFHRYPVDCWRFYPDAGSALQRWANREGYNTELLESFVGEQDVAPWNDFVAVFVKDAGFKGQYPSRIQDQICNFRNGLRAADNAFTKWSWETEDDSLIGNAVVKAASA